MLRFVEKGRLDTVVDFHNIVVLDCCAQNLIIRFFVAALEKLIRRQIGMSFIAHRIAECRWRSIPANIIAALKEKNLYVRCFLYELATKRFSDVMWAMQQIMFKGLDRRLAEFLLAEAERTGSDTIRMTHEQIAQHISSAREAVARMLKNFSEDGLVELKRGAITLRDTDRLNHLK